MMGALSNAATSLVDDVLSAAAVVTSSRVGSAGGVVVQSLVSGAVDGAASCVRSDPSLASSSPRGASHTGHSSGSGSALQAPESAIQSTHESVTQRCRTGLGVRSWERRHVAVLGARRNSIVSPAITPQPDLPRERGPVQKASRAPRPGCGMMRLRCASNALDAMRLLKCRAMA